MAVPSAAFNAMFPVKSFGHHNVNGAFADVVALDKSGIFERQVKATQQSRGFLYLLDALDLLDADIE